MSPRPNTAIIRLTGVSGRKVRIAGASVGGGNIVITKIDDFVVELTGEYHTLISIHQDKPGVVAKIGTILAANNVNIAFMRVSRRQRGSQALAVIEADQPIPDDCLQAIRTAPSVTMALMIPPLSRGKTCSNLIISAIFWRCTRRIGHPAFRNRLALRGEAERRFA